ncbi:hypothetical protein CDAR_528921 [Caerostris darwini]|uniref:Ycf1 n=1 Tax=Caerostris darwini TaxID=1538125 RepID=A0AAV4UCY0_9ARAC|nr:hypothetical protein CDAR_528921 [Caerostris darwini]
MKTRLSPFFILPDQDWPQLSYELKSQVPSLKSSLPLGSIPQAYFAITRQHIEKEILQFENHTQAKKNFFQDHKRYYVTYWRGCPRFPKKRHHQSKRKPEFIEKAPIRDSINFPQLQTTYTPTAPTMQTSQQVNHSNIKSPQ